MAALKPPTKPKSYKNPLADNSGPTPPAGLRRKYVSPTVAARAVPTLNPAGKSGPQGQPGKQPFAVTKQGSQPTTGSVKTRTLTAKEKAASALGLKGGGESTALQHAQVRAGHKFKDQVNAKGQTVHVYGKDVPVNLRNVVVKSAKRRVAAGR